MMDDQGRPADGRELQDKLERARCVLAGFGRVVVAFSGGVDSTLVAKLARDVLGREHVLAVTADSPSLAREDLDAAKAIAQALDIEHLVIRTDEVSDPSYQANSPSRCYVCKRTLFEELEPIAVRVNADAILYGAIGDDEAADRPGQRAAREYQVRAPLQEAGLAKWEVRELARALGLPNWDRPQNACLASRVPHGEAVTEEKLAQIECAESVLRADGFRQVRVRHFGAHARVEVEPERVCRLFEDATLRQHVVSEFARIGFVSVGVDRNGYRPGGVKQSAADEMLLTTATISDILEIRK